MKTISVQVKVYVLEDHAGEIHTVIENLERDHIEIFGVNVNMRSLDFKCLYKDFHDACDMYGFKRDVIEKEIELEPNLNNIWMKV